MARSKGKEQQSPERKKAIFERRERVALVRSAGREGVEAKDMPSLNEEARGRAAEQAGVASSEQKPAQAESQPTAKNSARKTGKK